MMRSNVFNAGHGVALVHPSTPFTIIHDTTPLSSPLTMGVRKILRTCVLLLWWPNGEMRQTLTD